MDASSPPALRALRFPVPAPLPEPAVRDLHIDGPAGPGALALRVVGAQPQAGKPVLLFLHGGGFVAGSADMDPRQLQDIARAVDCVVGRRARAGRAP